MYDIPRKKCITMFFIVFDKYDKVSKLIKCKISFIFMCFSKEKIYMISFRWWVCTVFTFVSTIFRKVTLDLFYNGIYNNCMRLIKTTISISGEIKIIRTFSKYYPVCILDVKIGYAFIFKTNLWFKTCLCDLYYIWPPPVGTKPVKLFG